MNAPWFRRRRAQLPPDAMNTGRHAAVGVGRPEQGAGRHRAGAVNQTDGYAMGDAGRGGSLDELMTSEVDGDRSDGIWR